MCCSLGGTMIEPYYQEPGIQIYCGDARKILPEIKYTPAHTALITDPIWPNAPEDMFDILKTESARAILNSTLNLITCARLTVIMRHDSDPRFLNCVNELKWPYFRTAILPYVMPGYIGRKLGGDELAYCFGEPIISKPGQKVIPGRGPKVQPNGRKANGHPCSRAYEHMKWLVRWYSNEDDLIIDPFLGSGKILRAAKNMNRKAVGIEIEEKWCKVAIRELKQQVLL